MIIKFCNYCEKNINVDNHYKWMAHRSNCKNLDQLKYLQKIRDWEYTNDKITYIGVDNKIHNYLLDFKVFDFDNNFHYIETKGWITDIDVIKWKTSDEKNCKVVVWMEEDLIHLENLLLIKTNRSQNK